MINMAKEGASQVKSIMNLIIRYNELCADLFNKTLADSMKLWLKQPCSRESSTIMDSQTVTPVSTIICPPKDNCPPRCLLTIIRHAHANEILIVPFRIRNTGNYPKNYRLGVRPLTDQHGNSIAQPSLDKTSILVQPGMTIMSKMKIKLDKTFIPGEVYETDIVIREKLHNQNVCFRLYVDPIKDAPEVVPYDEKDIDTHFHQWHHHYYCESSRINKPLADIKDYNSIKDQ